MPRTLVTAPGHDRMRSLGGLMVAWVEYFVRHGPGSVQGMPVSLGDEYAGFFMDCYCLDAHGRRYYDASFLSRPKGCAKSAFAAFLALFEAVGPARFDGWAQEGDFYEDPWGLGFRYDYEPGEPMGRPVHVPIIRVMATEESQSGNVYDTIYFNFTDDECLLAQIPGVDPGLTRVYLPYGGEIIPSTASSASKDGGKETFVVFDESHLYNTPELRRMYATVTRNLVKRRASAEGWFIETTTMFAPGEDSVAELTFREAEAQLTGKKVRGRNRLLYDHRWGICNDLTDTEALTAAIREAFGEAMAWNDIDSVLDEFYSIRADPIDSRRYFLNAETSSTDSWLTAEEWDALADPAKALKPRDVITLGFDGSKTDDSTALVACRVSDGHLELLDVWEKPDDHRGPEWRVDEVAVDAAIHGAMRKYKVVGFYADPPHWQDMLNSWHAEYAEKMQVKATIRRPLEWWTNRPTAMVSALERFSLAVRGKQISYTPSADRVGRERDMAMVLRRHALNARRMPTRAGLQIRKEFPKSPKKIDALMAAVLAYEARGQAIGEGLAPEQRKKRYARRLR